MKINSVNEYIQKREVLASIKEYLKEYRNPVILIDPNVFEYYRNKIDALSIPYEFNDACDVIIGIGGGKIMDQAKKIAHLRDIDCVLVPTSCSTDAACTNFYVEEDKYVDCGCVKKVIVDETILSSSPNRLLVSGIGDALSTYFESKYYDMPLSMVALSQTCFSTLMNDGIKASNDQKEGVISKELSKTIEAILYMSGTVYGNSGPSITHAMTSGFSKYTKNMHGEIVAFFLLVQLYLENDQRIHELREFYKEIGLPCHLKEVGLSDAEDEDLDYILSTCPKEGFKHFKKILKNEDIIDAIRIVDAFE